MRLTRWVGARRLTRSLAVLVAVVGAFTTAAVPTDASVFLGILSASRPASPPFVFSPNFMTIGPSGALITYTIVVTNLTTVPQTVTLRFGVNHILTYYGLNVADGQPGQPGIKFVKADVPNTTQQLVGTAQVVTITFPPAASGPTTLSFQQTVNICGYFQVDVGQHVNHTHTNLSGGFTRVLGCALGQRLTPGFWKNHQSATEALLPQQLGGYTVSNFTQVTAIFDAMKCSAPVNCLAGHLLAAQLDVSGGASSCISATVLAANNFLVSIGYAGPGSYTLTASQATQALAFESTLDAYTNDSTSAAC